METCHALSLVQEDCICRNPVTMIIGGQPYCRTHGEIMIANENENENENEEED